MVKWLAQFLHISSIITIFYIVKFGLPVTDPGVPYNVTVRARANVGKGEPVSIIVFSMQQGNIEHIIICILHFIILNYFCNRQLILF